MSLTLLLDLDDTLIDTNLDAFVPAYFQTLSQHLGTHVAPEVMLPALITGMSVMNESEDPRHTLQEVFESSFYEKMGILKEELVEDRMGIVMRVSCGDCHGSFFSTQGDASPHPLGGAGSRTIGIDLHVRTFPFFENASGILC
jgi:hypothetical protein